MTLSAGEQFAGYTVVRRLGAGGMGEVYLAQHPRLPRREALKVLRKDLSEDDSFRQRFIREADSIAALEHPHIVTIHDRGDTEAQLWIATQYVEGADAGQLLRSRSPAGMPADEVADIVTAIAAALDYAHSRGLLHRDVKPANILLADPDHDGTRRVYLADFGIARPLDDPAGLTATNFTLGTVAYAAPEQLMGKAIDGRADQYALAATAYHLLTGTTPFTDSNPVAVISQHLAEPPPPPSTVRPELAPFDAVFTRALSKNPADRYPRCHDFARALTAAARATGVSAPTADTQAAPIPTAPPRTPPVVAPQSPPKPKSPPKPSAPKPATPQKAAATEQPTPKVEPTPPSPRPKTKKQTESSRSPARASTLSAPIQRDATGDPIRNNEASRSNAKSYAKVVPPQAITSRRPAGWFIVAAVALLGIGAGGALLWRPFTGVQPVPPPPTAVSTQTPPPPTTAAPSSSIPPAAPAPPPPPSAPSPPPPARYDYSGYINALEDAGLMVGVEDGGLYNESSAIWTGMSVCRSVGEGESRDSIIYRLANEEGALIDNAGAAAIYNAATTYLC